jgi:hypothetical protein
VAPDSGLAIHVSPPPLGCSNGLLPVEVSKVQSSSRADGIIGACFATLKFGALLNLGRSLKLCDDPWA